jgi:anaerobic selenocysteine-containing dehydrogenase
MLSRLPYLGKLTSLDKLFLGMLTRSAKLGGLRKMRQYPDGRMLTPNRPGDYLGQRVKTPSGKVELAPADLIERAKSLENTYREELATKSALKLIQKRERFTHNSWAHNVQAFVKGERASNYLYIHSVDAVALSLEAGGSARVSANGNYIDVPVRIDDDMMPGTVSVPHGWGHQNAAGLSVANKTTGVNVNIILPDGPDSIEPASGMAHMNGVIVAVTPIGADA